MRRRGSTLLDAADESRVPADAALAVDREELREPPSAPAVVATGPLPSDARTEAMAKGLGDDGPRLLRRNRPDRALRLLDRSAAFAAGRYDQAADYLNRPLGASQCNTFVRTLQVAESYERHDWEGDPVLRRVPSDRGGGGALAPYGASLQRPDVVFAEQLTGVEGYTESAASGILAAIVLDRTLADVELPPLPPSDTMLGALYPYLREAILDDFQPMNSSWGLVDPMPDAPRREPDRRRALAARADASSRRWTAGVGVAPSGDWHLAAAVSK